MHSSLTGSSDSVVSSIYFMRNGQVVVEKGDIDALPEEDLATLLYTQEFIFYALERDDWLLDFLSHIKKSTPNFQKPSLTLINGGLKDDQND